MSDEHQTSVPSSASVDASDKGEPKSLAETLYGILRFDNGPPSDEEVKDIIVDYLLTE